MTAICAFETFERRLESTRSGRLESVASKCGAVTPHRRPLPLMSRDMLEFATIQGARACGLEALTGSLTPGKEADIVLLDTDSLNLMPLNNPHGVVVECAHAGNVDMVMVAGEIVKRDTRLLGLDLPRVRARVDAARDGLFRRANVSSDGSWLPRPFREGADVEG